MSSSKPIPRVAHRLRAVDFFCGAGGMSYGLSAAGINVLGGIDIDRECRQTYESNILGARFVEADVTQLQPSDLEGGLGITVDDPSLLMVACSPCQFYSQIRTTKTKSVLSAGLLLEFQRFVEYFRPGFVLIENVPRLRKETILFEFVAAMHRLGYSTADDVLNASKFGVPQNRLRYVLVASRFGIVASLPSPKVGPPPTVKDFIGTQNGFSEIAAGHQDDGPAHHTAAALSESNLLRIAMTPPNGGDRSAWAQHPRLQLDAYRERDDIFKDVYGRMAWDRPAPTITTKFLSLSNGRFGHPVEARAISVREGATLQTFPRDFRFHSKSLHGLARQIGNAVPPAMAQKLGLQLIKLSDLHGRNISERSDDVIDGRVARAKATLETVQAAYRKLVLRGEKPTASAILSITKGSKQTVLRHLKTINRERQQRDGNTRIVDPSEVSSILALLGRPVTSGNGNKLDTVVESLHCTLTQAIALGYVDLIVTQHGADRLQSLDHGCPAHGRSEVSKDPHQNDFQPGKKPRSGPSPTPPRDIELTGSRRS